MPRTAIASEEFQPVGSGDGAACKQDEDEEQDDAAANACTRQSLSETKTLLEPVKKFFEQEEFQESCQAALPVIHVRLLSWLQMISLT
jgi:hypothetical protein